MSTSDTPESGPADEGADALPADDSGDALPVEPDESEVTVEPISDDSPPAAFGALADENRVAALRALADADGALSFSELFAASPADTTAGFAYHLRQLDGGFVRKVGGDDGDENDADDANDEPAGYRLTDAGRRTARAMAAGTLTDTAEFEPVAVGDPCPLCGGDLLAAGRDNAVTVACGDCQQAVLQLPFPPAGHADRDAADLLAAFDRHHRGRLSAMADGVCPDCGADVDAGLSRASANLVGHLPTDAPTPPRLALDCGTYGLSLHCPVTLATLDHPAVVSFYHDHGVDVRDRPIWNVGDEWRETVVAEEPWCVRVSATLDGETLSLYVDGDLDVAGTRRAAS
jgi:hypothetical protein